MEIPQVSINRILFTTDLSDVAVKAFAYAASLATLYNAGIIILHVMADYSGMDSKIASFIGKENMAKLKESQMQDVHQALVGKQRENVMLKDALGRYYRSDSTGEESEALVADEVVVVKGNPVEQILRISQERNCDLIVMGTHGASVVEDMIGSTARKVLRRSTIPVLAVRLPGAPA